MMNMKSTHIFYFPPHQDDELTNLGVDLSREVTKGNTVHVVLCTDGSASGVKRMLCRGDGCAWHEGAHEYSLDTAAFVAARDAEFYESCLALGVRPENIVLSPLRAPDSTLTADRAEEIMRLALRRYDPADCELRTIAPMPGTGQNPDHTAVGQAALRFSAEYRVTLFYEFILLPPETLRELPVQRPDEEELGRIQKAASSYRRWAPAKGRYAVGYHSVFDEFNDFLKDPVAVIIPAEPT